jgi:SAM-dependent methyltransferase
MRFFSPAVGTRAKDISPRLVIPTKSRARDRVDILREHLTRTSKVLEIGPLFRPQASKAEGYNSFSVDKMDRETLLQHYKHLGAKELEKIEEVDFVWGDTDLADAIPVEHHGSFDVIIMSHVLEHVPNPIRILESCRRLLRPSGVVTLALPDKRCCFDVLRPLSTTAQWLDAYQEGRDLHTKGSLFDAGTRSVARKGLIAWTRPAALSARDTTFVTMALNQGYETIYGAEQTTYQDCHAWVFTPASFALIAHECHSVGACGLSLKSITQTRSGEFFAHLAIQQGDQLSHHDRLYLMMLAASEEARGLRKIRLPEQGWFRW